MIRVPAEAARSISSAAAESIRVRPGTDTVYAIAARDQNRIWQQMIGYVKKKEVS